MTIQKEARIVKRKGKYCVVGHKKTKGGKYRNFGCYESQAEAKKRLGQIYAFKHKKALLLNIVTSVSDELVNKGIIHLADAVINCGEDIAAEDFSENTAIKFGKVTGLLEKKGEGELAEQLDAIIPEILAFGEYTDEDAAPNKKRLPADRVYSMARKLKEKYLIGLIDQESFEYSKFKEFESMLKTGFLLPAPPSYESLPDDADNWWDHFANRGKK
jgi:hypothetical protein